MGEKREILLGSAVHLADGDRGEVMRVVLNPSGRIVRHLVVKAKYESGSSRLVPFQMVDLTGTGIGLRCTAAELGRFERAEETSLVYGNGDPWPWNAGEASSWAHLAVAGSAGLGWASPYEPLFVSHDRVPLGEVAVRRGQCVHALDGDIGRVQGLVVDAGDFQVVRLLLQVGHVWNHKQVGVPVAALVRAHDGLELTLTRQQVEGLPAATSPGPEPRLAATAAAPESG